MDKHANRNTWWFTRPKRSLAAAPGALRELVDALQDKSWDDEQQATQRTYERALEASSLKANRRKRDPNGGGPRTYLAWLRSLGLLWTEDGGKIYLTMAGQAIVDGALNVLEIMTRQVIFHQFPSPFSTASAASRVDLRFNVRPFIFLLQLLLDERLDGYLIQSEDVAKIVICYGENHSQKCVDDVVERILALRASGDASLDSDYLTKFRSRRSDESDLPTLFANLNHIANTFGNWAAQTQIITRAHGGVWTITEGMHQQAREIVHRMLGKKLQTNWALQENFQRYYGLIPGAKKDHRTTVEEVRSVSPAVIKERSVIKEFTEYAVTHLVVDVTDDLVAMIAGKTGIDLASTRKILEKKVGSGINGFLMAYTDLAQGSRDTATAFEKATCEIFSRVFDFHAEHIGQKGRRPDVLLFSEKAHYGAILDTKAYKDRYVAGHAQQAVMRNYIETYPDYALQDGDLGFFAYVIHAPGPNLDAQLQEISDSTGGVGGAAITAQDIVQMCRRHVANPYSHERIREMFSANRVIHLDEDLQVLAGRLAGTL
ncbi:restriction endonuclease FokI C-terminal domain-containing protein [Kocuria rhizophila]